ncbi:MAG: hypothetical protein P9X24_14415 [Candidatus Hatepunaea meridiana]|nr:hypothetical protein [Candidatus Hatepunaea meridiana]
MRSYSGRNGKGINLVELIILLIVIIFVAIITLSKLVDFSGSADRTKCDANRELIAYEIEMHYAGILSDNPSRGDWINSLTIDGVEPDWFDAGVVPTCPSGGKYSVVKGEVFCDYHSDNLK